MKTAVAGREEGHDVYLPSLRLTPRKCFCQAPWRRPPSERRLGARPGVRLVSPSRENARGILALAHETCGENASPAAARSRRPAASRMRAGRARPRRRSAVRKTFTTPGYQTRDSPAIVGSLPEAPKCGSLFLANSIRETATETLWQGQGAVLRPPSVGVRQPELSLRHASADLDAAEKQDRCQRHRFRFIILSVPGCQSGWPGKRQREGALSTHQSHERSRDQ